MQNLIDRVYEAAFVPELWPSVIERLGDISAAKSGSLLIMDGVSPPRWKATDIVRDSLQNFIESGTWRSCAMAASAPKLLHRGFMLDADVLEPHVLATDPAHQMQRALGLGYQLGCVMAMPTNEFVVWSLEHDISSAPPEPRQVAALNDLMGHLGRAGLVAARLGLERAQATASALQALGLPAAVLSASMRVVATNSLLDDMTLLFSLTAFDGIAIADEAANALFNNALQATIETRLPGPRSIPVKAQNGRPAAVVHVLPLRRSAHDVFSSAEILIVATTVNRDPAGPPASILTGLFDLSPAEARLAIDLTAGLPLGEAAQKSDLTYKTARTYLERIFSKTGTHRQGELVAMLSSVSPFTHE